MKIDKSTHNAEEAGKRGLIRYSIGGIAASLVAMLAVTYWLATAVVTDTNVKHQQALIDIYTQQITSHVNTVLSQKRQQITDLAQYPSTIRAMALDDPMERAVVAQGLMNRVIGAVGIQLIPVGQAALDSNAVPPISFATLDIINRTEKGEQVPMEVTTTNGEKNVQVARQVTRDDQLVGTVIVFLDAEFLSKTLADFDIKGSSLTLNQQFNGDDLQTVVASVGAKNGNQPILIRTTNPLWTVVFQPSGALTGASVLASNDVLMPLIFGLILVLASILLAGVLQQKAINSDAGDFTRYTAKLLMGQPNELPNFKLSLFLSMAKHLARVKIKSRATTGPEATRPFNEPVDISDVESVLQVQTTPKDDFVDIEMVGRDVDILGINSTDEDGVVDSTVQESIFRAVDIQGVVGKNLNASVSFQLGKALGSEAYERGDQTLLIARDGRLSSKELSKAFIDGLLATGRDVIDLGAVPIPVLYFAMKELSVSSAVMVSASAMPSNINGFRILLGGSELPEKQIKGLYYRINNGNFLSGKGQYQTNDLKGRYIESAFGAVSLKRTLKVAVDGGNGIAGGLAVELLNTLGCQVVAIHTTVDGRFPAHLPDPSSPENLKDLRAAVVKSQADVGIAFDGDGDRIGIVTNSGRIIWPDKLLLLFAKDLLTRTKSATILYDVNCSRRLKGLIVGFGGKSVMCKSSRADMIKQMKDTGALLGGNYAGNIFFRDKWLGSDDAIFAMAALLEIMSRDAQTLDELYANFPDDLGTQELLIDVDEAIKVDLVDRVIAAADFPGGTVSTVDGMRVDFNDGWGLIRPCKSKSTLACRFEGDNQVALKRIQDLLKLALLAQDKSLVLPF